MKKSEKEISTVKKNKFRNDFILAAVIIIIAVAGLLFIKATKVQGNMIVVKIDGVATEYYSLSEDARFVIKTGKDNENHNTVLIEEGKARVVDANCPDGICEEYRPISYVGETIICLPHKVVIEIVGEDSKIDLDAVA